jgi:hypothetical protein
VPIFQVGVEVIREQSSVLIVRVEAETESDARKQARIAVLKKCRFAERDYDLTQGDLYWETGGYSMVGNCNEDFGSGYDSDIDLTISK